MAKQTSIAAGIAAIVLLLVGGVYLAKQGTEGDSGASERAGERSAAALAQGLGIPENEVLVVGVSPLDWPNGCLGIAKEDEFCTQAITPGFLVILKAEDREYRYRTNNEATVVRRAP
ncbi:MAG: hypothetical protein Q7R88_00065 [bacterium]|nr:hypothetical protein [bacterium]